MTKDEQKKYKEVQSTLREVQLEREALRAENALFRTQLNNAEKIASEFRLDFFRVCNALQTVQNSVTMVTGALALDDIELSYEGNDLFHTRKQA